VDKGQILAFDVQNGEPRWSAPTGDHSYSSPQLATLAGQECVLMATNTGMSAHEPKTGKTLWTYEWKYEGYRVLQPLVLGTNRVLLATGVGSGPVGGTRCLEVAADGTISYPWTSQAMKPGFNDFVADRGSLFGVDNNILACIDLETGAKKWKDGRYGNGELLLLPDAHQILVLAERGDLVLLRANPEKREELARVPVLKGKTWNHPILVGNRVYIRNGEEAACFELKTQ
jgi:outer membrane protein assembly factor BamB